MEWHVSFWGKTAGNMYMHGFPKIVFFVARVFREGESLVGTF